MNKSTKITAFAIAALILIVAAVFFFNNKTTVVVQQPEKSSTENILPKSGQPTNAETSADNTEKKGNRAQVKFPTTGLKVEDFVVAPYEIVMEDKGLLDDDQLGDAVIVLQNKTDSTDLRPTLVLMGQADGSYNLYGISWFTVGAAYNNYDFQKYTDESVKIDSGKLKVELYGAGGPIGNQFNTYEFIDTKLVLTKVSMYNAGAGQQTYLDLDYVKNELRVEDVNTMKESMPTKITRKKIPKHKPYFFEKDEGLDFTDY